MDYLPFAVALVAFLALSSYQLRLPGLHYDEAKEAGLNAMELVTWQPVTAFREAAVQIGPWRLPLMVQDYIGALNVLLATPFLAVGGINSVALRWLPLLTAALTLLGVWRVAWRLGGSGAATVAALLLAVNPSFIFWSRQGIFVTNLTALLFVASLLTGLSWWNTRRPRALWLTVFLWGLGIYAKLLFLWAIAAMLGVAAFVWLITRRTHQHPRATTLPASTSTLALASTLSLSLIFFLLPLIPLFIFNLRTAGTLTAIFGNLGNSFYGVDNSAYLPNLATRLRQIVTLLRGDHFWYLGGVYANPFAPWVAGGLVLLAISFGISRGLAARAGRARKTGSAGRWVFALPVVLVALMVAQSAFTVSDLFITHYALLLPLIPLAGGLAFGALWDVINQTIGRERARMRANEEKRSGEAHPDNRHEDLTGFQSRVDEAPASQVSRDLSTQQAAETCQVSRDNHRQRPQNHFQMVLATLVLLVFVVWAGGDLWTTIRYHRALSATGGHASHSDAIYDLAGYLALAGPSAPVALDWGLDAQTRFLTAGRVKPIELFGYAGLDAPDPGYADRLAGFLDNPDTVYLAHAPGQIVFQGRVEALQALAAARGLALREEARFSERAGAPLFIVYRVVR